MTDKIIHDYDENCPYQIFKSENYNYLTGIIEKFTGDGWQKEKFKCDNSLEAKSGEKETVNMGIKPLLDLKDFDPRVN
jgi:hypothetical protein